MVYYAQFVIPRTHLFVDYPAVKELGEICLMKKLVLQVMQDFEFR